jgi:poly(3-hydroxyalkanoate) depolymerase
VSWSTAEAFFLDVSGLRIRVRVAGSGPPLLLVMGIGANLDMWEPLIPALGEREIIAFDAPGTGGSASPRIPLTMRKHATLVRKLLDRLGFSVVDVLGYSWGGLLAQKLAIDHPNRVRRLVLAATMPGLASVPGRPSALWRLSSPRRYYSRSYFEQVAPDLYGGRARTHPDVIAAQVQHRLARPPSPTGYVAQIAATWTYSGFGALQRVTAPTLVLAGDDDPIVPLVNSRLLGHLIRDTTVQIIEGGHLFLIDGTPGVGDVIRDFLDQG